jgi:hypothetical protein
MTRPATDIVNTHRARPQYSGLPCSSSPGVPLLGSTSIMLVSSSARCDAMRPLSKRMLCEPLPRGQLVAPVVEHLPLALGAMKSIIRGSPVASRRA